MKKNNNNNKGFTLAELLIVVAIIAVLVAIAIPVFGAQLHKAQDATDIANCRSLYADLQADFLTNQNKSGGYTAASSPIAYTTTGFTLSDGQTISLKHGAVTVTLAKDSAGAAIGWSVSYDCGKDGCVNHGNSELTWGVQSTTTGGSGT